MSDDYLWDKSGTPDPEIEELEQLLGDLRYRRPAGKLPLPERAPASSRRTFSPALAIAAALLFMTVAAGVWFAAGVGQRVTPGVSAISIQPSRARDWPSPERLSALSVPSNDIEANKPRTGFVATNNPQTVKQQRSTEFKRRGPSVGRIAKLSSPSRREPISDEEGLAAREQLIKALHLASSKLNLVQKKVQDNKSLGPES